MKDVCADCGNIDPTWASLNRGILLCQDCCTVHRSIGRHVSWVRSLHQGWWSPTLLMMVETLNKAGANSVWEHSLLDQTAGTTSCRPSISEHLHAAKEEFIHAKHEELQYTLKGDQDLDGPEGLGAQLHAAARTPDLLTSLRLLSQGADPGFYHEEKGSTPLHVAAKSGQALQVELLLVHGADYAKHDKSGRTAEDAARDCGHLAIAERLRSCRYHAMDRLVQYLCSRKPGTNDSPLTYLSGLDCLKGVEFGELTKEGRTRLQSLSNSQFEKLVADVYDEVDRREAGAAWTAAAGVPHADPTPFLPVHPELSATRNQGRQKLGRLSLHDFDSLIRDVLIDARRRDASLQGKQSLVPGVKLKTEISDDEPLYDSVASDEDYATPQVRPNAAATEGAPPGLPQVQKLPTAFNSHKSSICSSELNNPPQTAILSEFNVNNHLIDDNGDMRRSLASSAATIAKLQCEIQMLQDKVVGLMRENRDLKDEMSRSQSHGRVSELSLEDEERASFKLRSARPTSMYETRERMRNWNGRPCSRPDDHATAQQTIQRWPEHREVVAKTSQITKRIQELCMAMKVSNVHSFTPCALRINTAVADLSSLFPMSLADPQLRDLAVAVSRLQQECLDIQSSPASAHPQFIQSIRHAAYEVANATKQLVVKCENPG